MMAVRLNPDGVQDTTFGNEGRALAVFGEHQASYAYGLVVMPDDRMVLGGAMFPDDFSDEYDLFALAAFTADGKADSSFGSNGTQLTGFVDHAIVFALALQADGKIVAAGITAAGQTNYDASFAIARYNGEGTKQSLIVKLKRFLHNHGITWNGNNSNVAYYSVERSTGAGFREVSRMQAKNVQQSYNYIIPSTSLSSNTAPTIEQYCVRAVSNNGQSTYSNIVSLNTHSGDGGVSVYPNPVLTTLTIKGLNASINYEITVTDLNGTVYLTSIIKQQLTTKLDVSKLQRGNYVLNISNNTTNTTLKFMKE